MAANSPFKNDVLKGKVALITGGGTGINFGIGQILGLHGCTIAITGRRENVLREAVQKLQSQGIKAFAVQGDVRSVESATNIINAVVKEFGRLDILINGAAGNFLCPAENLTTNAFKTVVEIDLIGTFNMSRAAFEELKKTKGSILNISATLHYSTTPWQVHASAAKAGVDSITTSLAAEWGEFGIRVNGIAPGPIKDTVGMEKLSLGVPPNQLEEAMAEYVPLRKMGTKDDIGYAALYLACDAANYVTGDTIVVDGGAWLYHTRFISREALTALEQERRKKAKL